MLLAARVSRKVHASQPHWLLALTQQQISNRSREFNFIWFVVS